MNNTPSSNMIKTKRDQFRNQIRKSNTNNVFNERRKIEINDITKEDLIKLKMILFNLENHLKNNRFSQIVLDLESFHDFLSKEQVPSLSLKVIKELKIFEIIEPLLLKEEFMKNLDIMYHFLWSMGLIFANSDSNFDIVIENKFLLRIMNLLNEEDDIIISMSSYVLGNLIGENTKLRDYLLNNDLMELLKKIMNRQSLTVSAVEELTWLSNNLCHKPYPDYEKVGLVILPFLSITLSTGIDNILEDTLWILTYLSEGQNFQIENIIKLGMVEHIIKSAMDNNQKFNIPSLRILGNLATGTNDHVEILIEKGILEVLVKFLKDIKLTQNLAIEILWILSNILVNEEFVEIFLNHPIANIFFEGILLYSDDVKKEHGNVLINLAKTSNVNQILKIMEFKVFDLIEILIDTKNTILIISILKSLKHFSKKMKLIASSENYHNFVLLLSKSKIFGYIEEFQVNKNEKIAQLSDDIILYVEDLKFI